MSEIAIVGAGISGLLLARELHGPSCSVTIFEQSNRVGGWLRTEKRNGFLLEFGANSLLLDEKLLRYFHSLGLSAEIVFPQQGAKKRYVAKRGKTGFQMLAFPSSLFGAIRSPLLSAQGKFAVLRDLFSSPAKNSETVAQFFSRHFGKEIAETFVGSFVNGIWAGDIHRLDASTCFPRLWTIDQKFRSLLFGLIFESITRRAPARPKTVAFQSGMETLPKHLVSNLGNTKLELETFVEGLLPSEGGVTVRFRRGEKVAEKRFDSVFLCHSGENLGQLIEPFDEELSRLFRGVQSAPIGVTHLALAKDAVTQPLDGFGVLFAPAAGSALLGCIFSSSLFEERAPAGMHLLTCLSGGIRNPENGNVDEPEILAKILDEVKQLLQLTKAPQVLSVTKLRQAIPQYELSHPRFIESLQKFHARTPSIRVVSSVSDGIGVPARMRAALSAAEAYQSVQRSG